MIEVGIRQIEKSGRCADLELRRERKCVYMEAMEQVRQLQSELGRRHTLRNAEGYKNQK